MNSTVELEKSFQRLLKTYPRIAIAGGPRCGKSTLAKTTQDDRRVVLDDEFDGLSWEVRPHALIASVQGLPSFVVESVQVPRALRKGLEVDAIVYLHKPRVSRTKGQITMAKGAHTVFTQWREQHRDVPVFVMD